MKSKDIIALAVLGVVLIVVGSLLINYFGNSKTKRTAEIEVVRPIDPSFNQKAREILQGKDPKYPVATFSAPPDTQQGFGNTSPFTGN